MGKQKIKNAEWQAARVKLQQIRIGDLSALIDGAVAHGLYGLYCIKGGLQRRTEAGSSCAPNQRSKPMLEFLSTQYKADSERTARKDDLEFRVERHGAKVVREELAKERSGEDAYIVRFRAAEDEYISALETEKMYSRFTKRAQADLKEVDFLKTTAF